MFFLVSAFLGLPSDTWGTAWHATNGPSFLPWGEPHTVLRWHSLQFHRLLLQHAPCHVRAIAIALYSMYTVCGVPKQWLSQPSCSCMCCAVHAYVYCRHGDVVMLVRLVPPPRLPEAFVGGATNSPDRGHRAAVALHVQVRTLMGASACTSWHSYRCMRVSTMCATDQARSITACPDPNVTCEPHLLSASYRSCTGSTCSTCQLNG